MLFYWIRAFFNISFFSYSGKFAIIGANLTMLFLLIYRGLWENHFPLSNHAIKKDYHLFIEKKNCICTYTSNNLASCKFLKSRPVIAPVRDEITPLYQALAKGVA